MLRTILIPLSYIIGVIISNFTKEELLIRKKWFKKWPYLLLLIPLSLLANSTLCMLTICAINYLKSSNDFITKVGIKRIIIENLIFLLAGIIVSQL